MPDDLSIGDIAFINRRRTQADWTIDNRRPPDWHVLALAISGRASYRVDGTRIELSAGDAVLLPPGCRRLATTDPARPWTFASAAFRLHGTTAQLPVAAHPGTVPAVRLFAEALAAWSAGQMLLARARLCELVHVHLTGSGGPTTDPRLAAIIAELARRPAMTPASAEQLARAAGLSPSRFRVLFRAATGLPLHRWQNRRRLAHARTLLLEGRLDVGGAAAEAGFSDQHHFSRLFRQHFGLPPSACLPH